MSGGGSSQPQTTTTTQKSEPWAGQQPYLTHGFEQAKSLLGSNNPSYYPGDTVTGFNPFQQMAQSAGANRAMSGNPLLPAAQNQAMSTLQGDYLNAGNPHTAALTDSINAAIRPGIDSRFSGSGRYGSAGHAQATTSAMTNALAPHLFGQYGQERQNQLGVMQQAPGLANADYTDINALSSIGQTQQAQSQAELEADIAKHNFEQNLGANKLAQYMGLIQGNYGGEGTSTSTGPKPPGANPFLTAFGLGTSGLGTAGGLGWNPLSK